VPSVKYNVFISHAKADNELKKIHTHASECKFIIRLIITIHGSLRAVKFGIKKNL